MIRFITQDGGRVAFYPRGAVEAVSVDGYVVAVVTNDAHGKTTWTWELEHDNVQRDEVINALLHRMEAN